MKTALYFRVSTTDQTNECQVPEVMALVAAKGWTVVKRYEEKVSAVKYRPEYEKMKQAARDGEFEVLVVWALDRLGRSMVNNVADVVELSRLGIRIISVKEPWMDGTGPVRELLVAIFSWVAQQDRTRMIERTKAGIAVARANGQVWGRPSIGLPPTEREQKILVAKWAVMGRLDGFLGLAGELGCSVMTARKLWLRWGPEIMEAGQLPGPVFYRPIKLGAKRAPRVAPVDNTAEVLARVLQAIETGSDSGIEEEETGSPPVPPLAEK